MSVTFKHSNKVFVKKDQEGYVKEFYPKQYTITTDPFNKEINYLNVSSKRVTIDGVDIEFSVNNKVEVEKSYITKLSDDQYIISKEGHPNFGEIGTLYVKYNVMKPVTITVTNEQIAKDNMGDLKVNDHVELKRSMYKAGVINSMKPSQVRVELINGTVKTFDVQDIFYIDIELDSNDYVQINAIKNDKIYGNTLRGENLILPINDQRIKYKNFEYNSKDAIETEDQDNTSDSREYLPDEQDMVHGFKSFEHTELVLESLSKEDKNLYTKIKKFMDNVNDQDCFIKININSVIKIYNRIMKTLKEHLNSIDSVFKNKNNLIDESVILYLVIIYNASMLNGHDVCCVYNKYIGDSGLIKYIAFLKEHFTFNAMMLRTSKFTNKNALDIFGNGFKITNSSDPIECIITNCDNVLRNVLNVGFSNLDELPLECATQQTQADLIPLKPYYKMEVPGYKITDKRPTANVLKNKAAYTEQEIEKKLEEAKRKNYKEAQKQWQKLKDDLLKEKTKKQIINYYEYNVEYNDFNDLLHATMDDLHKKMKSATLNNKLKNVERFKYILENLLNFDNFKQQSNENAPPPKNKKDVLNVYQNILFDNYKAIYTKNLMIENHNKLKMLNATLKKSTRLQANAYKNKALKDKVFDMQNKTNALLRKYTIWFNKYFEKDSPREDPEINMNIFIKNFKNVTEKSKSLIKTEPEDLSKLFGDIKISDSSSDIMDEDESSDTNSTESNTASDNESDEY
jgi:hypothetical protein